jgi:hypothetical protein
MLGCGRVNCSRTSSIAAKLGHERALPPGLAVPAKRVQQRSMSAAALAGCALLSAWAAAAASSAWGRPAAARTGSRERRTPSHRRALGAGRPRSSRQATTPRRPKPQHRRPARRRSTGAQSSCRRSRVRERGSKEEIDTAGQRIHGRPPSTVPGPRVGATRNGAKICALWATNSMMVIPRINGITRCEHDLP